MILVSGVNMLMFMVMFNSVLLTFLGTAISMFMFFCGRY